MEQLTVWSVNGQKLELDITDADTLERYENSIDQLKTAVPERASLPSMAAYVRAYCKAHRDLYDALFGKGTGEKIFADVPDNVRRYNAVYASFLAFVAKQAGAANAEMAAIQQKYLPKGGIIESAV